MTSDEGGSIAIAVHMAERSGEFDDGALVDRIDVACPCVAGKETEYPRSGPKIDYDPAWEDSIGKRTPVCFNPDRIA